MTTFVLVHGGWHGGWCWKYVTPLLRAAKHEVYTPTLTGVGERAHLVRPGISLDTHIQDIIGVLTYENLQDVILVGHSLAGPVIEGVADRIPQRIAHLAYLDASVPRDGEADVDCYPDAAAIRQWAEGFQANEHQVIPPLMLDFGITNAADLEWVHSKLTPHPVKAFIDRIQLANLEPHANARTFIYCTQSDPAMSSVARARTEPGWRYEEIDSGHDAMVIAPQALVNILLACI
jgi:pimeloyl-ACP methyl ester carboxylesterase